jgi:uncharacterized protein (DUF934 family)
MALVRQRKIVGLHEMQDLIPLAQWKGEPGVLLTTSDDPAKLDGKLDRLSVVAIEFPQFTDGRGHSIARLLRERFGYKGELRAVGDVFRDNLFYLSRCGFDSFLLSDQGDTLEALDGLSDFSEGYQTSVERPQPLFRRRAA